MVRVKPATPIVVSNRLLHHLSNNVHDSGEIGVVCGTWLNVYSIAVN
jgi:hypothetical protein